MKTGFLFLSMLDTNDISRFALVNELLAIQTRLMTNSQLDDPDISIEVFTESREDLGSGSILLSCSTNEMAAEDGRVAEIFNSLLEDKESLIKEFLPGMYLCGVNIGALIKPTDMGNIRKVIEATSNSTMVVNMINMATSGLTIDDTAEETVVELNRPVEQQPVQLAKKQPAPTPKTQGVPKDGMSLTQADVMAVAQQVVELLQSGNSEFRGSLDVLLSDKEKITSNIVDSARIRVSEFIDEKLKNLVVEPQSTPEPTPVAAPSSTEAAIESIIGDSKGDWKPSSVGTEDVVIGKGDNSETHIYDNPDTLTISKLMEGCESDNELFQAVLERKEELSMDDLENVATFNMFAKMSEGKDITNANREQRYRRTRLGL